MKIGQIVKTANGFEGTLHTLSVKASLQLVPTESDNEKAPAFRVMADGAEIGAAWEKTSKNDKPYLSVKLDDPAFAAPVYAVASVPAEGEPSELRFERRKKKED